MLQQEEGEIKKEYATILAFDVKVTPEATAFAEDVGVKIMTANIIYHLFDEFTEYHKECVDERKKAHLHDAVYPCILSIVPGSVFRSKKPIILGLNVKKGKVKIGTPICVPDKGFLNIGRVTSIEHQRKPVEEARSTHGDIAVKIEGEQ